MKKRIFAVLMAIAMAFALVSCGDSAEPETQEPEGDTSVSEPAETTESENTPEDDSKDTTPEEQIAFESMTVVDNDECSIRITGVDTDGLLGCEVSVELENKSSEKTYMFAVNSAAVNGLQNDPLFASEVAAGKKSIETVSFTDSTLEENGIDFSDIELTFRVYDSDDWEADDVALETVHVYPYGEDKAGVFERAAQATDNIIMDNEYVTVTVISCEEDDIWGYTVNMFLENKTDKEVMFAADDVSVNGYMADPFWADSVLPGKCAFSSMIWSDTTLEENGIDTVDEIEFVLRAYDYENSLDDDLANEQILLSELN